MRLMASLEYGNRLVDDPIPGAGEDCRRFHDRYLPSLAVSLGGHVMRIGLSVSPKR